MTVVEVKWDDKTGKITSVTPISDFKKKWAAERSKNFTASYNATPTIDDYGNATLEFNLFATYKVKSNPVNLILSGFGLLPGLTGFFGVVCFIFTSALGAGMEASASFKVS